MSKCPVCQTRKPQRSCPGIKAPICSRCCGAERGKKIVCDPACSHLEKSNAFQEERENTKRLADFEHEIGTIIGHEDGYLDVLSQIERLLLEFSLYQDEMHDADIEIVLQSIIDTAKVARKIPVTSPQKLEERHQKLLNEIENAYRGGNEGAGEQFDLEFLRCIWRVLCNVREHAQSYYPDNYLGFIEDALGHLDAEDGEEDNAGGDDASCSPSDCKSCHKKDSCTYEDEEDEVEEENGNSDDNEASGGSTSPRKPHEDIALPGLPYVITERNIVEEPWPKFTDQEEQRILRGTMRIGDNPNQSLKIIRELLEKYPDHPVLRNHEAIALLVLGRPEEHAACVKQNFTEHPDYLYGRLAMANLHLDNEELEAAKLVLKGETKLEVLVPGRDTFHITEFVTFCSVIARYLHAIGDEAGAKIFLTYLEQVAPKHFNTRYTRNLLKKKAEEQKE
ncbi:MAG: hypothetical protein WA705_18045 [Candidatus Ozemobacteraceae bacterium]